MKSNHKNFVHLVGLYTYYYPIYICLWTRREATSTRFPVSCSFWSIHNLSFFSFSGCANKKSCCFKSQGRQKDDSSIQQHSVFTIWALGLQWHIPYFDITWHLEPSGLGFAHKPFFGIRTQSSLHFIFSSFQPCMQTRYSFCLSYLVLNPSVQVDFVLGRTDCTGYAVAQLVEALRYKPEGRWFDSRWSPWIFHLLNLSGRTMALVSTQTLTEMSTSNISWGVKVAGA